MTAKTFRAASTPLLVLAAFAATPNAAAAGRCGDPAQRPWCDTSKTPEQRTELVLAAMRLDEKLQLMAGDDLDGFLTADPATGVGNGVPRLGIPTLFHSDGPFGPREGRTTAMPGPLALASTFDPNAAAAAGAVVADEVKKKGNDLVHAPTVEPMRTPLAGRTFETYGEDPLLSARIGVGWIKAAQREGIIANVKHFAPNSQEGEEGVPPLTGINGSRFLVDARIDDRTLHEIYFPAFEAAVKQGDVGAVMCAYGALNGDYACESKYLLKTVLRGEWKFNGLVVSDYGFALKDVAKAINAGTDIEMPIGLIYNPVSLLGSLASGQVSEATIDARVGATLRTMFKFGLFDRDAYPTSDNLIDKPAHAAVAQRTEEQGIVLLQNNDNALPLDTGKLKTLAVIGDLSTRYKGGGGSSSVEPFAFKAPLDAIKARAQGVNVRYDPGSDLAAAAGAAKGADAAVVFVEDYATEGADKPCLRLRCAPIAPVGGEPLGTISATDGDAVIAAVAAANPNTIVVLETGGPVLTPWHDKVKAVLEAWYPGQDGGPAIARVLFGDVDPGGRLPVSFPAKAGDWPTAGNPKQYPGVAFRAEHSEGVLIGYRHYDHRNIAPRWAFGHGLSYTTFRYRDLRRERSKDGSKVRVSAVVQNTGTRTGYAVPQLYLGMPDPDAKTVQPPFQLKDFTKLRLAPGKAKRVRFALDSRAFSYWSTAASDWRIAPGCYRIAVGASSRDLPLRGIVGRDSTCDGALRLGACTSKRAFTIRLPRAMRSATVRVAGKRVAVRRRGGRLTARVDLRATNKRTVNVTVVGRSAEGKVLRQSRVYRPCA